MPGNEEARQAAFFRAQSPATGSAAATPERAGASKKPNTKNTALPTLQKEDPGGEWQTAGDITSNVGIGLMSSGVVYAQLVGVAAFAVGEALKWNANDQRRQAKEKYEEKYAAAVKEINKREHKQS